MDGIFWPVEATIVSIIKATCLFCLLYAGSVVKICSSLEKDDPLAIVLEVVKLDVDDSPGELFADAEQ